MMVYILVVFLLSIIYNTYMKTTTKNIKILMYIATIISLLSIASLYFIYKNPVDMEKVVNFEGNEAFIAN